MGWCASGGWGTEEKRSSGKDANRDNAKELYFPGHEYPVRELRPSLPPAVIGCAISLTIREQPAPPKNTRTIPAARRWRQDINFSPPDCKPFLLPGALSKNGTSRIPYASETALLFPRQVCQPHDCRFLEFFGVLPVPSLSPFPFKNHKDEQRSNHRKR